MTKRIDRAGLKVAKSLASFIEENVLPGLDIDPEDFWYGFSGLIRDLTPQNRALLDIRKKMQDAIDSWHVAHRDRPHDHNAYKAFLSEIGYIVPEGDDFEIETQHLDPEIAEIAGPQLVVPVTNARFALNAANARWGSLYDCLYGTDAIGDLPDNPKGYDRGRGARVVGRVRMYLDEIFPITDISHADAHRYRVRKGQLLIDDHPLKLPDKFVGYWGDPASPEVVLLKNNGLHVAIKFDATHPIGKNDRANIADVEIESALTAIMDCEDSVACVDADDKVAAYANWLGLMRGDLEETFNKNGTTITRRLSEDRNFFAPDGSPLSIKGRALMWVRNVGHLMTTPAILDPAGNEVFEGLLDAVVTVLIAMHDLERYGGNSRAGSIYVVKPKMHGPDEVAFADKTLARVEDLFGLPRHTVKIGVMDEERRTSVNLKECIRAAKHRLAFINTGFLDRTGDEIHTSMEAGPFSRKAFIKRKSWITAYENQNVDIGLECGLSGKAQIGKGMWAMPDQMADMLEQKIEHPRAGASCAWVPSPTAATLHALHYHKVNVRDVQQKLARGGRRAYVDALLDIPLATFRAWNEDQIIAEVENNAQGILGYVVRWIDLGIGCSKVPDLHDVAMMEDRATCRISAQHVANWLHHGVVTDAQVRAAFEKMALIVDRQNAEDPAYEPMGPAFDGEAYLAACELVLKGREQPSGYTEPILHHWRPRRKVRASIH
ncbi:malate synthase G [Phaeobacter inhibens]|uniref:malate synthase G n=1 Tax=Phaeobacter inhibens TaxID=221822 RepID=UPI00076BBA00|nr:malate synthase G [Phaeobacter inhibens]KXF92291.1 malate synthase G [Phaeobacter inhibens]WHP68786.1 malate synthase G [Phaeobacter inhibens]